MREDSDGRLEGGKKYWKSYSWSFLCAVKLVLPMSVYRVYRPLPGFLGKGDRGAGVQGAGLLPFSAPVCV